MPDSLSFSLMAGRSPLISHVSASYSQLVTKWPHCSVHVLPFIHSTVSSSSVLHVWKSIACHTKVLFCKRGSCPLGWCDTDKILKFKLVITHQHTDLSTIWMATWTRMFYEVFRWQKYLASVTSMYIRYEISFRLFFPHMYPALLKLSILSLHTFTRIIQMITTTNYMLLPSDINEMP